MAITLSPAQPMMGGSMGGTVSPGSTPNAFNAQSAVMAPDLSKIVAALQAAKTKNLLAGKLPGTVAQGTAMSDQAPPSLSLGNPSMANA